MTNMLERAANAVADTELGRAVADQHIAPLATEVARAVIQSMMEPSDGGLDAFARAFGWQEQSAAGRENARFAWKAMLTHILSEGGK